MVSMTGKFIIKDKENYRRYLRSIGVPRRIRYHFKHISPVTTITHNGDEWNIRITYGIKVTEIQFKLGEEFDDTTLDGRPCRSRLYTERYNILTQAIRFPDGATSRIVRVFGQAEMIMIAEGPGDTVSICVHEKRQLPAA